MPRPTTKDELLRLSEANYSKLLSFIDGLTEEEQEESFPEGTLNRNIRDVLGHLHHWHLLLKGWHDVGLTGEKPHIPAEGYTWKTNGALNKEIRLLYANKSLKQVRDLLNGSHLQITSLIEQYSEQELFEKKRYKWTGSTSLGAYLISSTSSHYDWALKLIKKCRKRASSPSEK